MLNTQSRPGAWSLMFIKASWWRALGFRSTASNLSNAFPRS